MGKLIPWASIEPVFKAGNKSLSEIAAEFGVAESTIIKKAKREAWIRSDTAQSQDAPQVRPLLQLVADASPVPASIAGLRHVQALALEPKPMSQDEVIVAQRQDVSRARALVAALMQELEEQTCHIELLHELSEAAQAGEEKADTRLEEKARGKRNELLQKALSHSNRTSTMKTLVDSLRLLIGLEREAHGLDVKLKHGTTIEEWLDVVSEDD
jgi:hypothetical protein